MPKRLEPLTPSEGRRIDELLAALRSPIRCEIDSNSPLMVPAFVEEFQSRLVLQHLFLGNPLYQESFDRAFIEAARTAGFEVQEAPSGQRFWDVEVDGRRLSLKSTKAKNLSEHSLHISKLTEAAWIQDCRTASKRHRETCALFNEYCQEVDEILQLRYFVGSQRYELVGVPVDLFQQILELRPSEFHSDGPSIGIPVGQIPPDFTLKIDRSDAKITIARILKSKCIRHGDWTLQTLAA